MWGAMLFSTFAHMAAAAQSRWWTASARAGIKGLPVFEFRFFFFTLSFAFLPLCLLLRFNFLPRRCRANLPGRIYEAILGAGVLLDGSRGRVEGCKIWGNADSGVTVKGDGSEAVVVGCKCAGGRAGVARG